MKKTSKAEYKGILGAMLDHARAAGRSEVEKSRLYTKEQVAVMFGRTGGTIANWHRTGVFDHAGPVVLGRHLFFNKKEFDMWLTLESL